jgi:hypothetical protein
MFRLESLNWPHLSFRSTLGASLSSGRCSARWCYITRHTRDSLSVTRLGSTRRFKLDSREVLAPATIYDGDDIPGSHAACNSKHLRERLALARVNRGIRRLARFFCQKSKCLITGLNPPKDYETRDCSLDLVPHFLHNAKGRIMQGVPALITPRRASVLALSLRTEQRIPERPRMIIL